MCVCCLSDALRDWWEHCGAIIRTPLFLMLSFFSLHFAHYNPVSLSLSPWLVRAIEMARLKWHWLQQRQCKEMPIKPPAGRIGRRGHDSSLHVLTQGLSHGHMKALSGYRVSVCFLFLPTGLTSPLLISRPLRHPRKRAATWKAAWRLTRSR